MTRLLVLLVASAVTIGCTSVGSLGIVAKPMIDPGTALESGKPFISLGPAYGKACRNFLLGIVPWGDAEFSKAVNNALRDTDGDALINVTVSNSFYGYIPVFNIFAYTCTTVSGVSIKFQDKQGPG